MGAPNFVKSARPFFSFLFFCWFCFIPRQRRWNGTEAHLGDRKLRWCCCYLRRRENAIGCHALGGCNSLILFVVARLSQSFSFCISFAECTIHLVAIIQYEKSIDDPIFPPVCFAKVACLAAVEWMDLERVRLYYSWVDWGMKNRLPLAGSKFRSEVFAMWRIYVCFSVSQVTTSRVIRQDRGHHQSLNLHSTYRSCLRWRGFQIVYWTWLETLTIQSQVLISMTGIVIVIWACLFTGWTMWDA